MPRVIVSIANDRDIDVVAEELRRAGLAAVTILHAAGVVLGEVAETEIAAISAVPGVRAVEREGPLKPMS